MKIISFNVNGLRSILDFVKAKHNWSLDDFLDSFQAEIICFQETKINDVAKLTANLANPQRYNAYYAFHQRANLLESSKGTIGYSGVVTFSRKGSPLGPLSFEEGFTGALSPSTLGVAADLLPSLDAEGRCAMTDHGFLLVNTYCPNDSGDEARQQFRVHFYKALWQRLLMLLRDSRSVVWVGDINISYHPRDHCDFSREYDELCDLHGELAVEEAIGAYIASYGTANVQAKSKLEQFIERFYAKPMRRWLYHLLHIDEEARSYGLRDSYRLQHADRRAFTCWNTLTNARASNYGSRIDMIFLAGPLFRPCDAVTSSGIMVDVLGSDHCPIYVDILLPDSSPAMTAMAVVPSNTKHLLGQQRLMDAFKRQASFPQRAANEIGGSDESITSSSSGMRSSTVRPAKKPRISDFFAKPKEVAGGVESAVVDLTGDEDDVTSAMAAVEPTVSAADTQAPTNGGASSAPSSIVKKVATKPLPLCKGHQEPCVMFTVNKKGPNRGRKFFLCSRNIGDPKDPAARCGHFEWQSVAPQMPLFASKAGECGR